MTSFTALEHENRRLSRLVELARAEAVEARRAAAWAEREGYLRARRVVLPSVAIGAAIGFIVGVCL